MRLLGIAALAVLAAAPPAGAAVNVVTSTEDLADLVRQVGGDRVKSRRSPGATRTALRRSQASFILKLAKADLLVAVGRELEIGWLPPLVSRAETRRSSRGRGLPRRLAHREDPRDPTGQITRAMGDVHPSATRTTGSTPATAGASPRRSPTSCRAWSHGRGLFRRALRRLRPAPRRGEKRWDAMMAPYRA